MTLATLDNMKALKAANPGRTIPQPDGSTVHIEPRLPVAFSPLTGEQYSADPGDYWGRTKDTPLYDSEGEPMLLVYSRTHYYDAFTGEAI